KLFRRRRHHLKTAVRPPDITIDERRKRRRRDGRQFLEKFPAGNSARRRQPLRQVYLINIAGADVPLRADDGSNKFRAGKIGGDAALSHWSVFAFGSGAAVDEDVRPVRRSFGEGGRTDEGFPPPVSLFVRTF